MSISDVAVVATRFVESVLREARHHATTPSRSPISPRGGKEVVKRVRSGQKGQAEPEWARPSSRRPPGGPSRAGAPPARAAGPRPKAPARKAGARARSGPDTGARGRVERAGA